MGKVGVGEANSCQRIKPFPWLQNKHGMQLCKQVLSANLPPSKHEFHDKLKPKDTYGQGNTV